MDDAPWTPPDPPEDDEARLDEMFATLDADVAAGRVRCDQCGQVIRPLGYFAVDSEEYTVESVTCQDCGNKLLEWHRQTRREAEGGPPAGPYPWRSH